MTIAEQQAKHEAEIARLKDVVGTLIVWMGASANSPLNRADVVALVKRLNEKAK